MSIKKHLLYLLCLCALALHAQEDIIRYDTAPATAFNEACKGFILEPGFTFKAAAGSSLIFRINNTACSPTTIPATISADQNYIITLTPLGQTQSVIYKDGTISVDRTVEGNINVLTQIQYFDGLGRPLQTVQIGITPSGADLATYQEYDAAGRESKAWLPAVLAGNNGAFAPLDKVSLPQGIYKYDSRGFSEPVYEASPLNRVLEGHGPGDAWYTKPVTTAYLTNTTDYPCISYTVAGGKADPTLIKGDNYENGQLYVTQLRDEEGHTSYEFKDKLGQVVLTRQMDQTEKYDTYYVYDDFGNLCFVLPPLASTNVDLDMYGYQYKYDDRNRCTGKKLPGVDWIFYVYDRADRLIFTQDGEQRKNGKNEWLFSIPDAFGRIVLTGTCRTVNGADIYPGRFDNSLIKAEFVASQADKGYTLKVDDTGLNLGTPSVFTANYYDDYAFLNLEEVKNKGLDHNPQPGYASPYASSKGLLTGSITALLDGSSDKFLYTAIYYDYRGQIIQTKSTNHLGGLESEYIAYTFSGSPTQKLHTHTANGNSLTELYTYTYDHAGRLLTTTHQLNNGAEVLLAQNSYDELGRLSSTTANNHPALATTFDYNIRSWTNRIASYHFVENLDYNLNGNIKTQNWQQVTKNRTYAFTYDQLSRIKSAQYTGDGKFDEDLTYDKHGNIESIVRYGAMGDNANDRHDIIDQLELKYTGNQLRYINDQAGEISLAASADFKDYQKGTDVEYAFNANGAMTMDLNKGIVTRSGSSLSDGISYNALNLPQQMVINNNEVKAKNYYTYSAAGTKLRVVYRFDRDRMTIPLLGTTPEQDGLSPQRITDYVGNKIYEEGVLKTILTDNGYIEGNTYYFYTKDHLGNNRIVANAVGGVIQSNQYYPFGMAFAEGSPDDMARQDFKYNGKELDRTHGLNQYDYEARYYDPSYARFTTVDPLAEKFYNWSPYVYCYNNPIKFVDPTGMEPAGESGWADFWADFLSKIFSGDGTDVERNNKAKAEIGKYKQQNSEKNRQIGDEAEALIETTNHYMLLANPYGVAIETTANMIVGEEVTVGDIGWSLASISPLGISGKGGKAAQQGFNILNAFKNAISSFKGGKLTNVGRAITKHPSYFGFESTEALMKVYRTPEALNKLGSSAIKDILRNGVKTTGAGGRYPNGWVTYTLPNGNAASWGLDGSFIGFRGIK